MFSTPYIVFICRKLYHMSVPVECRYCTVLLRITKDFLFKLVIQYALKVSKIVKAIIARKNKKKKIDNNDYKYFFCILTQQLLYSKVQLNTLTFKNSCFNEQSLVVFQA